MKFVYILFTGLLAGFVWSAVKLGSLSTEYSFKQFYPQNHEILKVDREVKKVFQLNERSPFLYLVELPGHQDWLNKTRIKRLQNLTNKLAEIDQVEQAVSMTSIEGAAFSKNEILIGNFFDRVKEKNWRAEIKKNPLIYPLFLSKDLRTAIFAVYTRELSTAELKKKDKILSSTIGKTFPQARVTSAGVPVMQTQLTDLIKSELGLFFVVALVVFCLLLFILFSHWSAVVAAFLILAISQIFALGLLVLFKVPMNVILSTLPIIVSVAVMSLIIHTFHAWSFKTSQLGTVNFIERWRQGFVTLKDLMLPNCLGALTTAIGFLALAPSEIPIIKQYGWVVFFIVCFMALYGQGLVLISLPFVRPTMRSWFDRPATWALVSIRRAKPIFWTVLTFSVFSVLGFSDLNFSGKLFTDLPAKNISQRTTQTLDQKNGGLVTYDLVLEANTAGFFKERNNIYKLSDLAEHLRQENRIGSVLALPDFFQGNIPAKQSMVSETLFLFSMAEKNPLNNFVTEDAQKARLMIRLTDQSGETVSQLRDWVKESIHSYFPNVIVKESGMAVANHTINQLVAKSLVMSFWHPLVLIALFLGLIYRSFRLAFVACLPNLIPPFVLIGVMAATNVVIKPSVALVFAIALGFAFNNTIYLLDRMRKKNSLAGALEVEANPCAFESLVMFFGFSVFVISQFSVNQLFGVFMMISILVGFIGDLFFLPAVLTLFPKILDQPQKSQLIREPSLAKAASISALLILGLAGSSVEAATATDVLKRSQKQIDARDDQALVEMKIIEKNGEEKIRKINLRSLRGKTFYVIAKIESPADVKGMGFLGQVENGEESQWIYLPSSQQVRRVVTGKTKAGLLGSEISAEDLNTQAIRHAKAKLLKGSNDLFQIEVTPKKGTSAYTKVVSYIDKGTYLPKRAEYYVGKKKKKTVEFSDYKKIGSVFRAQKISVKNLLNGRMTEVRFSEMKVNSGLSESDFTQNALKRLH